MPALESSSSCRPGTDKGAREREQKALVSHLPSGGAQHEGPAEASAPRRVGRATLDALDALEAQKKPEELVCTRFGVPLCRMHFECLLPDRWLTDEIVNCFLRLVQDRHGSVWCPSSFFWPKLEAGGHAAVKRWSKRASIDWTRLEAVLVPLHLYNNHWCLCAAELHARRIVYFDSMPYEPPQSLLSSLCSFLALESPQFQPPGSWELLHHTATPMQRNDSDCGVFTCAIAARYAAGVPLEFETTPGAVSRLRLELAEAVVRGYL